MSNAESIEAQNSEFEVLQAIYFNDGLCDLRKTAAWNRWQPLKFALTLTPQQGSTTDENARVDLLVTCSEHVPTLSIQNEKGISQEQAQQLLKELRETAQGLVGNVMVYELAQYVQEFLYKHSKPVSKSFYEQMMMRTKQQQLAEQEKENHAKETLEKEVKERQELHKQANKRYRDDRRISEQSSGSGAMRTSFNDSSGESCGGTMDVQCDHGRKIIQFSNLTITRGQCLEHPLENCVLFTSMDTSNGQMYLLSEWTIGNLSENNTEQYVMKQISGIEQELRVLLKLRHSNFINYANMEFSICSDERITVNLLSDFVIGSNCNALFLSKHVPVEVEMLRMISESVLSALDFLHRNNVVHKNLTASSVYICNNRGLIKVSNFSIYQRLTDLVSQSTNTNNYSKKMDIYDFGVLILSLMKGNHVDKEDITIPYDVGMDFRDFIEKCILKDEYRYSTTQLLEHSFLKAPTYKRSPIRKTLPPPDEYNSSETQADDIKFFAQPNLNGKSRVETEFERLDYIGEGAYGQVFKVRNKLDQRMYALKSIELTSKSKLANRKIIREVKLLSGLNHENVVRYYNSWIESATVASEEEEESEVESVSLSSSPKKHRSKFTMRDAFMEKLVPNFNDFAWSISYGGKSSKNREVSDDSESSSIEEDAWSLGSSDTDSLVEFETDENEKSTKTSEEDEFIDEKCKERQIQIMYIQMEFCDKSTLRTAIDNDIYKEKDRLWRLFREIIEGLTHIHQQGMIHRDLKPVNIFLDVYDHVKIGDFGLATSNLLTKNEPAMVLDSHTDKYRPSGDPSLTGQIGTALYVAPELTSTAKATYNQKVDIYSLGIIFFEMSYKPCATQTERIQILSKLRTDKITFPKDFDQMGTEVQQKIIKWLLDHKPINRPTSLELLQSDHMPPPVLEERELRDLVRHTLKNPQLKAYKYLVESCLNQPITAVQDISYDNDMSNGGFAMKNLQAFNHVKDLVVQTFELHGAQELSTPLLMPKNKSYDAVESCVRLMTHSGSVVTIPHDLRIPFARYVAWNGITSLRRYSIAKVYREKRAFGFIPRELYECAFDIVTPSTPSNLMADAEVIYLLDELATAVPGLRDRNLLIRLNHTSLLKAMLLYCGIKDRHSEFYSILADWKECKVTKMQVRTHLISNSVSNHNIATLFKFLDNEASIGQIHNSLQTIIKRRNTEPGSLTRQALQELQTIIDHATNLGVTNNIVINLGLIYIVPQYSGMICQLAYPSYRKNKHTMEVLAAGGRYDDMINTYKSMIHAQDSQSAVGVSISLDRMVAIFTQHQHNQDGGGSADTEMTHLDVVVGSTDKSVSAFKNIARILRDLRAAGIKATGVQGGSQKEITEQGDELNVPYLIIYKDGQARVHHCKNPEKWEQCSLNALVENLQRVMKINRNPTDLSTESTGASLSRSESTHRSSHVQKEEANVNIVYMIYGDREKMASNLKKRFETQIKIKMNEAFNKLNGEVTLFAMNVDGAMICQMASCFSFDSEEDFQKSLDKVKERYPKHKKYLDDMRKKIYSLKSTRNHSIILFSLEDFIYRVFL